MPTLHYKNLSDFLGRKKTRYIYLNSPPVYRTPIARGLQGDVVNISWRIAPLVLGAQMGGKRGVAGSQPIRTAVHITWHGATNLGDITPYLTYAYSRKPPWTYVNQPDRLVPICKGGTVPILGCEHQCQLSRVQVWNVLEIHPRISMEDDKMDPGFFSSMPHKWSSEGSSVVFVNIIDVANFCNQEICGAERIGKT